MNVKLVIGLSLILVLSGVNAQAGPTTSAEYHTLLFKWKEDYQQSDIKQMKALWQGLVKKIDGLDSFEMREVNESTFDHVVILKFSSKEAEVTYSNHADHKEIIRLATPIVDNFVSYSY